ncbi:MAG: DUF5056 domain-containing protein [Prevotellaceae bacterium]|jgi:hypothetical protein|nr:DUF5056 domain-containing protein [Prevotellaceae bacterium]
MINEQDLKNVFAEHRADIADNGFSRRVAQHLPPRRSLLPQIIPAVFTIAGFVLTVALQDMTVIEVRLLGLVNAVAHLQMPSSVEIMTYLGVLATMGFIGFAAAETDIA